MRYAVLLLLLLLSFSGCTGDEQEPPAERLHPRYAMTGSELEQLTADLPLEIRENIARRPEYFLQLLISVLQEPEDTLYMVDKEHSLFFGDSHEAGQLRERCLGYIFRRMVALVE